MTKQPRTIARSASLADAHELMREHHLRHLPVLDNGKLIGIVSLGDLHLLETIGEFPLDNIPVDEAMSEHPFVVTGDMPLDEIAEIMATNKYGSAIIVGRDGVEGIFTMVDACRTLASILQHAQLGDIAMTD